MDNAVAPARLSRLANSDHRAIRWRRPAGHASHPKLIEATIHRLMTAMDAVTSHRTLVSVPLWDALSDALRVFDASGDAADVGDGSYVPRRHRKQKAIEDASTEDAAAPVAYARPRKRTLRRDGGINLITTLCTLLWNADFSTIKSKGYIGQPMGNGSWEAHTWQSLFKFGFGEFVPGEKSLARLERWTRVLADAGFIKTYRRWNEYRDGAYEELPAVKILTTEIFKLCGTFGIYKRMRKEQAKEAETERARAHLANMGRLVEMDKHRKRATSEQSSTVQANLIQQQQDAGVSTGPPRIDGISGADDAIAYLRKRFGKKEGMPS